MEKQTNGIKHGKRNFGIFLIIIQIMAIYGTTLERNGFNFENILQIIGFFIFGICGIILITIDYKLNKKEK